MDLPEVREFLDWGCAKCVYHWYTNPEERVNTETAEMS